MGYPRIEKPHRFVCVCRFSPLEHPSSMAKYLKLSFYQVEAKPAISKGNRQMSNVLYMWYHSHCETPANRSLNVEISTMQSNSDISGKYKQVLIHTQNYFYVLAILLCY